jgi:hypothetical protein
MMSEKRGVLGKRRVRVHREPYRCKGIAGSKCGVPGLTGGRGAGYSAAV